MRRHSVKMPIIFLLLQLLLCITGGAVNPGCECLVFSSTYGKEYGTFSSPDYPRPYPDNMNCLLYSFIGRQHEVVQLTFTDFDVQKLHLDCSQGDHVKLFLSLAKAEVNEWTPHSGLLCGGMNDVPSTLYSSGPALVFELHTDAKSGNHSGFIGRFRFLDRRTFRSDGRSVAGKECDQAFVSSASSKQGRFYSARYPSSYPSNVTCSYSFRGRENERIRVVFEEVTLQKGDISCLERADTVSVYDGSSSRSPAIAVLCDEATELEVLSTGRDLYVELVARSRWPGQGFRARYQFQNASDYDPSLSTEPQRPDIDLIPAMIASVVSNCDVTFTSDLHKNGSITSPGYPGPYPALSHCRYDFQGRGKERVQIIFSDFRLHQPQENPTSSARDCESMDALVAYLHMDGRMEKIDSFCGSSLPKPLMSNGPRLLLEFKGLSFSSHTRGFKASFSFTQNFGVQGGGGHQLSEFPCAFSYNATELRTGIVTSPNFPGLYPRDTECHYFFYGTGQQRVRLRFHYFDVEGVLPCEAVSASDYVEFSNFMARDRKYSRYCGQLKEFEVVSDHKFFRVTFRSNDRLDGSGFNATYEFLDEEDSQPARHEQENSASSYTTAVVIFVVFITYLC